MAGYSTSNPPVLLVSTPLGTGVGPRIWGYVSTDADTVVRVTGYITNGGNLGMKVGDLVIHFKTPSHFIYSVVTVSATAPGAVDLSNSTALTSATNSD
jgi:hypothetical protein